MGSSSPNSLAIALPGAGTSFAIQGSDIANGTIAAANIGTGTITSTQIAAGTIGNAAVSPYLLQYAQISVTAAQIIAAYATPLLLVAAPASGTSISINNALIRFTAGATAFTGGGAMSIQYGNTAHGAGGTPVTTLAASQVTSATSSDNQLQSVAATTVIPQATALYLSNATAAFATGNGTMTIFIWYSIT